MNKASIPWLFMRPGKRLSGGRPVPFGAIWHGKKRSDFKESIENTWLNIGISMTFVITSSIVIWLGI